MNYTQDIKEQVYRLGFSLVGVTTPDPLPHADVFNNWIARGRHGEMAYLDTARSRKCRAYPQEILPECRSVLVLGIHYPPPPVLLDTISNQLPSRGKIAAYAQGIDYHDFLPERIRSLIVFIETQVGHSIPNRWYIDTGPLLERELAMRAGLGWIGKNTCLINPELGSYFLLAEILLGIELEIDQPFMADRCGSCSRCIAACPTGCILPDRTLDSRRCISYLTIESKRTVPNELRPLLGTWVFGCDVCQQVCPWNRFAVSEADPAFDRHHRQAAPNLLEEITLTNEEFARKYHRHPVMRAKRRGYLRNVTLALGNSGGQEAVLALSRTLLDDQEPLVRAHAAWALGQIGGESARQALLKASTDEKDIQVLLEVQAAMDRL